MTTTTDEDERRLSITAVRARNYGIVPELDLYLGAPFQWVAR